jgi:predicted RNase H-like HicB family nuclease
MNLTVETEQEDDGRWLGEVPELPGVMAYGKTRPEAIARVQALALRTLADRLEHGARWTCCRWTSVRGSATCRRLPLGRSQHRHRAKPRR